MCSDAEGRFLPMRRNDNDSFGLLQQRCGDSFRYAAMLSQVSGGSQSIRNRGRHRGV